MIEPCSHRAQNFMKEINVFVLARVMDHHTSASTRFYMFFRPIKQLFLKNTLIVRTLIFTQSVYSQHIHLRRNTNIVRLKNSDKLNK